MPWQAAEPGSLARDANGGFHIRVGDAWIAAPPGSVAKDEQGAFHYNPDALQAPPPAAAPDPIGTANKEAEQNERGPVGDTMAMLRSAGPGIIKMLEGIGQTAYEHPLLGNIPGLIDVFKRIASDPSGTITSVSNAVQHATPEQVGENVVGPLIAGGVAGEGAGLVSRAGAAGAAEAATPAGQLGLRTASGPGATMAGSSAGTTLDIQNQRVASSVLGADAGVPHNLPVTAENLAKARIAPGRLLDQGYAQLPTGPLSPSAQALVRDARGPATITKPTPNVSGQISDIESSLLDPHGQFTGEQLRATRNSLNSDATAGAGSADADTRAMAAYKRGVVSALDQHLEDSLPQGAAVTPDMVSNARATLGKNYQLEGLIGPGGDINLQALAKLHRESPGLLTGNTRNVAQFASDHPEVTGGISDNTRISPPSMLNDVSGINPLQRPLGTIGQAIFGGVGRRLLRGAPGEAIGRAMQAPVAGANGEFDLRPLDQLVSPPGSAGAPAQRTMSLEPGSGQVLHPTGGLTASPPTAPAPAAPAPPGQISLADLLAHGVEQGPAPGLTAGPMGAPPQTGVPFRPNLEHAAGGLSLADELPPAAAANNSDLAHVASQGVPEGIMARSTPPYKGNLRDRPGVDANRPPPAPEPGAAPPETAEGGGLVFRSPNGQTIVRRRGDALQVSASLTKEAAQGAGEGTQRMIDAFNYARNNGLRLVSDTKVSDAAAKIYDRLEKAGYQITRNPVEADGKGNLVSTAGRPAFEVSAPSAPLSGEF
jgi:hypothetical protein